MNYSGKGLTGLANMGNTCFLNSCMQIFSHTYPFNDFLNNVEYKNKLNSKPETLLLIEWDKLRKMMWSENCTIAPGAFIKCVHKLARMKDKDIFTGWAQNDLPEFLLFVIDCFHTALLREVDMEIKGHIKNNRDKLAKSCYEMMRKMYTKEYSEILKMFYGIHISHIISLEGDIKSSLPEPFFLINLPIPPRSSRTAPIRIEDCFFHYIHHEKLTGDDKWFNEETGEKEEVYKKISFWSLPDILVFDLKRFTNTTRKNNELVEFPLTDLDLSNYVEGYNKRSYIYDLYGVCNHSGGLLGGHYTSYIKNANGLWYHFNDTSVTEIKDLNKIVSSKAYCFFYQKKIR
jgi:ubiquitin C-terminal hydrolase